MATTVPQQLDQAFAAACMDAFADVVKRAAEDLGVVDEAQHLWAPETLTRFSGREGGAGCAAS
ncbi:hypothetical protein D3093_35170 (plasmid) [Azospirillum argentinense]|uniref:Uncharacterized protein n=1 Tax=Azospirillum argentinense TaxID=2970906 RepID=A0A4D8PXA0_9PROT|nr:hypothetical protein [Azospirillum argentinense]QCO00489.1 hypothetical protein D3093_35170 [Azospirillum argentinense]